jgi:hypothetical protein
MGTSVPGGFSKSRYAWHLCYTGFARSRCVILSRRLNMAEQCLRLLSVDWDYFFPDPIRVPPFLLPVLRAGRPDSEATLLKTWLFRAGMYLEQAKRIPETSGDEAGFWSRFTFSPDSSLFTAESHRFAAEPEVMDGVSEIWNFDAHHDAGYEDMPNDKCDDGNWLMAYSGTVERHVRYPSCEGVGIRR